MTSSTRYAIAVTSALIVLGPPSAMQTPAPNAPRLVVMVVVDQMRSDYLQEYASRFTGGLKRLMEEGAWFQNGAYPYLNTVTCPGHATIGTGTLPWKHGMILNEWYERREGRTVPCSEDRSEKEIVYSGTPAAAGGESAKRLLADTLAEQMRERAKARVVAMSLKPRSAIMMAGAKADAVVWQNGRGAWVTSTAYTREPVAIIKKFIDEHPIAADAGKVWERAQEASSYKHEDDAPGETPPSGWTRSFPHPLAAANGKGDARFITHWQHSPFADEYLGRMAAAAVEGWQLGRGRGTDFLGVSFSSLDSVGHAFGPRSHEVQDLLFRLDATIGRLLTVLDERVGRGNYIVGFSSDHGVAQIPEQVGATAGRQVGTQTTAALEKALTNLLGPGPHVATTAYTNVYLMPGVYERLRRDPRAMAVAIDTLRGLPGVAHVFRGDELTSRRARESSDPVRRAAALSHQENRGGDLVIVPRENWLFSSSATTHGTMYPYDQRVPVIVFGAGVAPGVYPQHATPADIAPTLAALAEIRVRGMDGRVLTEAMNIQ
jgi:predicted AlkP superfamily pyrophosphatase or phosphodiesterase